MTVVLELDNLADNSDDEFFTESLSSLAMSIRYFLENGGAADLEFVVVADSVASTEVCTVFEELISDFPNYPLTVYEAPGSTYYEKKMIGGTKSVADFVVFVDSDVVYSTHWFATLANRLLKDSPDVIYGETYAMEGTPRQNAMAVAWQFPFDGAVDTRRGGAPHRWSNNWAVKTDILIANPLPRISGNLKAEGTLWDYWLMQSGVTIESCIAKAFHRQPATLGEWWSLAVRSGQAKVVRRAAKNQRLKRDVIDLITVRYFRDLIGRIPGLVGHEGVPAFSPQLAVLVGVIRHFGVLVGFVFEVFHPRRALLFDYSTIDGHPISCNKPAQSSHFNTVQSQS